MGADDAIAELYAGSLKSFVTERKALAKALREEGDKDGARQVTAAPKPSMPAWVVNQLRRHATEELDAVLAAIDRQRDLQLGALAGGLDADALGKAKAAEKAAMSALTRCIPAILEGDGHAASKGNIDRVTKTVRAAALDPDARELMNSGRLVRDVAEGGFEAVASQLDPAMLLAALSAKTDKPKRAQRKVDGMFARSARSDADRTPPKVKEEEPEPAPISVVPTPSPAKARRRKESDRDAVDKTERLARAKVSAANARNQIAEQQALVDEAEERVAQLERDLDTAKAEARIARRKLGDLKERLEQANKRIRLLERD